MHPGFLEPLTDEVLRIYLLRASVNKLGRGGASGGLSPPRGTFHALG
jgi:hypothetical protein